MSYPPRRATRPGPAPPSRRLQTRGRVATRRRADENFLRRARNPKCCGIRVAPEPLCPSAAPQHMAGRPEPRVYILGRRGVPASLTLAGGCAAAAPHVVSPPIGRAGPRSHGHGRGQATAPFADCSEKPRRAGKSLVHIVRSRRAFTGASLHISSSDGQIRAMTRVYCFSYAVAQSERSCAPQAKTVPRGTANSGKNGGKGGEIARHLWWHDRPQTMCRPTGLRAAHGSNAAAARGAIERRRATHTLAGRLGGRPRSGMPFPPPIKRRNGSAAASVSAPAAPG